MDSCTQTYDFDHVSGQSYGVGTGGVGNIVAGDKVLKKLIEKLRSMYSLQKEPELKVPGGVILHTCYHLEHSAAMKLLDKLRFM